MSDRTAGSRAALRAATGFSCLLLFAVPVRLTAGDAAPERDPLAGWTYVQVSASHVQVFGMTFARVDGDAWPDILSGPYWYRSPGGDLTGAWTQHPLPQVEGDDPDALLAVDVDGDANFDVIAMSGTAGRVYWLERNAGTGVWTSLRIGDVGVSNHGISSQGYRLVDLEAGGRPEIVINVDPCYYFRIPADPAAGNWPRVEAVAAAYTGDEEIAFGDIDRDGRIDLVTTNGDTGEVRWLKNPGNGSGNWAPHLVATLPDIVFHDRLEVADFNRDGRLDIVVSEETGSASGAETWWLRQPADPTSPNWPATLVVSQGSTNSMRVADVDRDGDADIVTAEHYGSLEVIVWNNDGAGVFTPQLVDDAGHESHFGVRPFDLDRDGDPDLVSPAWNAPQFLHLWRNDTVASPGFLLFADGFETGGLFTWSSAVP
ncbi:MAG: VCBS repeat-containing protein [Thermoanaerobaculia bacterium]|jgi:hypothetical protein|nr:MAG: VCBS repeat-containing protein [Thermoanaerobaculia bacterium]MBZ0103770.1 VCBS repeat-containing protein [Thermoanaerobaculia bacterium]